MISKNAFIKSVTLLAVLAIPAALAQVTQDATATVAASNELALTTAGALAFAPVVGTAATASDTVTFGSNDGSTYDVKVVASTGGWAFTPSVAATPANTYPVLNFVNSSSVTGGTAVTTGVDLILADNTLGGITSVVTGVKNSSGGATINYSVGITQTVVAGSYAATLEYSLVTP